MAICKHCGSNNPEGVSYCAKCGEKLSQQSSTVCRFCGNNIPDGATYCGKCGGNIGKNQTYGIINKICKYVILKKHAIIIGVFAIVATLLLVLPLMFPHPLTDLEKRELRGKVKSIEIAIKDVITIWGRPGVRKIYYKFNKSGMLTSYNIVNQNSKSEEEYMYDNSNYLVKIVSKEECDGKVVSSSIDKYEYDLFHKSMKRKTLFTKDGINYSSSTVATLNNKGLITNATDYRSNGEIEYTQNDYNDAGLIEKSISKKPDSTTTHIGKSIYNHKNKCVLYIGQDTIFGSSRWQASYNDLGDEVKTESYNSKGKLWKTRLTGEYAYDKKDNWMYSVSTEKDGFGDIMKISYITRKIEYY